MFVYRVQVHLLIWGDQLMPHSATLHGTNSISADLRWNERLIRLLTKKKRKERLIDDQRTRCLWLSALTKSNKQSYPHPK